MKSRNSAISTRRSTIRTISAVIAVALLAGCTGRTPDGKVCRKNMVPFIPTFTYSMANVCPQKEGAKAVAKDEAPAASPAAAHGG